MLEQLKTLIRENEIISFDIFDTLITRMYNKPTDLFKHLEEACDCQGFYNARISGEARARAEFNKNNIYEVTLDEIYSYMHSSLHDLMDKEIQLEKIMCKANPEMMQIYKYCLDQNKIIIISSDMYLDKDIIEYILKSNGYDQYEHLFLSSETKRPKTKGMMYEDILQYSKDLERLKVLHIGANSYTDYQLALQYGIAAYAYTPIQKKYGNIPHSQFFSILRKYDNDSIMCSILSGMISLNECKRVNEDYWYKFGYNYGGIIAFLYCQWLHDQFEKDKIDNIFFMLRDGYIFQKVFNIFYPEIKTTDIFGSRRMFLLATAKDDDNNILNLNNHFYSNISFKELYDSFDFDDPELEKKYKIAFPDQNKLILEKGKEEIIKNIKDFFIHEKKHILKIGEKERKNIIFYLNKKNFFSGKNAVVNLGWKATMVKELESVCKFADEKDETIGYYFGTHKFNCENTRVKSYTIDSGLPNNEYPYQALNSNFIVKILELMFSAPHPSIMKINVNDSNYDCVYAKSNSIEDGRIKICKNILRGVTDFTNEIKQIVSSFPIKNNSKISILPLEYFFLNISKHDEVELGKVSYYLGIGNDESSFHIDKNGRGNIAMLNPWPGDKSAESEVITRMKKAADNLNVTFTMLDDFGHILDPITQKRTNEIIDPKTLDFAITTHYETHKSVDCFYYHTLWNPPEIPLNLDYYTERVSNNYIMNDDFLLYDFGGMKNHLQSMLLNKPRDLNGASMLTASFPQTEMLEPRLPDDPKMFYCGMNWEKVVHHTNRHEGLFKLLDKTKKTKFFGPDVVEAWGGLRPWEGYESYQYSIPFDGFSILKEINDCGICLVISSDIHRRAGAVTNRAYEACAAGAVIISDNNDVMSYYFKDAALFIDYDKNEPQVTFNRIMEKYNWILAHPKESLELAKKAQKIFIEHFSLEKQIKNILNNHPNRFESIKSSLFAKDTNKEVIVYYILNDQNISIGVEKIKHAIKNVENQYYLNIRIIIAVDISIFNEIEKYIENNCPRAELFSFNMFGKDKLKQLTNGQMLRMMQKKYQGDYFTTMKDGEVWFYDHITTLIRSIEDDNAHGSYSGKLRLAKDNYCRTDFFNVYNARDYYLMNDQLIETSGNFLFKSECNKYVPDFLFDCIDGTEHLLYANLLYNKYNLKLSFSKRMTLKKDDNLPTRNEPIISYIMQRRFIQDLVKFEVRENDKNINFYVQENKEPERINGIVNPQDLKEVLINFPIKLWFKLRYYRKKLRTTDVNSAKGAETLDTFNKLRKKFLNSR